jgi:hypothetical protein
VVANLCLARPLVDSPTLDNAVELEAAVLIDWRQNPKVGVVGHNLLDVRLVKRRSDLHACRTDWNGHGRSWVDVFRHGRCRL